MLEATDLPLTQTQNDEPSQELGEVKRPWGRLCACISTMVSIDLFEPVYTFGRAPSCNIFVDESQFPTILNVSKHHFRLTKDEDDLVILTDLSKNGTFVNRTKIGRNNKSIIYNEDVIAIGSPSTRVYSFICDINRDDYEFLPRELRLKYTTTKLLGRGSFGQVRLALDKQTREQFAIKRIEKSRSSISTRRGNNISGIKTEVEILSSFSHAFIIQMREVFETDDEVFLVLEYMSGGELTSRIRSSLSFPECEVKFIFYQILLGVRYLHLNGVTHRDLKPENVLLSTQNQYPRVKISDFGLSKIMDDISVMETVCGTVQYAAPEVLRFFEPYNRKVDVWSLGVILFYMLSRTQPFVGSSREEVAKNIVSGKITWDPKAWRNVSLPAKNLVKSMITVDSTCRYSIVDIFKHDWVAKDHETRRNVEELVQNFEDNNESGENLEIPKRRRISFV